jgi:hypothetical protein
MSLWGNDNQQQLTLRPTQRLLDQVLAYTANVIAQKNSLGRQCPAHCVRLLANLLLFISVPVRSYRPIRSISTISLWRWSADDIVRKS